MQNTKQVVQRHEGATVHDQRRIHCNIKTENMMLMEPWTVDNDECNFGMCIPLAKGQMEPYGTPLYSAPENLCDGMLGFENDM